MLNDKQGTGRRKTAVAAVILRKGTGKRKINGEEVFTDPKSGKTIPIFEKYFKLALQREEILAPLVKLNEDPNQYDMIINVKGGGLEAQAIAVRLGLSRALEENNEEARAALKALGFLTRDSRKKERKKPGQKGARKRFQFSKR
jgi:small subunit ribosomal protein S9